MTTSLSHSVLPADPSWWFADALKQEGGQPNSPSLAGEITVDVAIVGGGYTGLWTALALKARTPRPFRRPDRGGPVRRRRQRQEWRQGAWLLVVAAGHGQIHRR